MTYQVEVSVSFTCSTESGTMALSSTETLDHLPAVRFVQLLSCYVSYSF